VGDHQIHFHNLLLVEEDRQFLSLGEDHQILPFFPFLEVL
jgi:hypothetical protein